jgi:hypothetical protein
VAKQRDPSDIGRRIKRGADSVPWALLLRGGVIVGKRWNALTAKERARLATLLRESHGRLSNLSTRQRLELRRLSRKLDLKGMGRELRPLVRGGKRSRKRG